MYSFHVYLKYKWVYNW